MSISLAKKQTISLDKEADTGLCRIRMGLGWDPIKPSGFFGKLMNSDTAVDLDASCIVVDSDQRPVDVVWFRQLTSSDGLIAHSGDNRTGDGSGDDETISVNLEALSSNIKHLVFTVNSFLGQTFEKVGNAYCRIVDDVTGKELARFNLSDQGDHTGMIMAYLTRTASGWDVTAVGQRSNGRTVADLGNEAVAAVSA
ncbi:TerD family protein [Azorhizophilus paspali]|uniref:TerD family protein n=1 Tax=Azorhizophilus paspali TaxID=69963 RepID=A0ABV6SKA9_AZOPA